MVVRRFYYSDQPFYLAPVSPRDSRGGIICPFVVETCGGYLIKQLSRGFGCWWWCSLVQCAVLHEEAALGKSTTSIRLEDELRQELARIAAGEGTTVTELIERFVREGLAVAAHPGIVFKGGPAGRRAALGGGPDVWEIVAALRQTSGSEAKRVARLAEQFGLHKRQIVIALNYAADHRDEIDARVASNEQALADAERVATERQRLLA